MSRTLTGWSFWGTRGSRGTEAPARQPGTHVNPLQRAGPIRVRAEIPSATRKRPFLNHAKLSKDARSRANEPTTETESLDDDFSVDKDFHLLDQHEVIQW